MNFKDLLIPLILAFATTWAIQYFFIGKTAQQAPTVAGQSFTAPAALEVHKPLNTVIAPADKPSKDATISTITTQYGTLNFSTYGATLERIAFMRSMSGHEQTLIPLQPAPGRPEAFLIAFENDTPIDYTLASMNEESGKTTLVYLMQSDTVVVRKQFVVIHDVPKIDVEITVQPKNGVALQPRLFLPAPYVVGADIEGSTKGLNFTLDQKLQREGVQQLGQRFWITPTLFGLEDRYFIHALVNDADAFTQRAFFRGETPETVTAIFEAASIHEAKTWKLSFYCGPKDVAYMSAVDPRLELTLDYGWFSVLVKLLLIVLKWIYGLVHNYGWAIIILTFLIRLLMVPFTLKGHKAMEKQKEFQQKMRYIEQKYKDDPAALAEERVAVTKKYGTSGMLGCLPQLAQIPILVALNRLLSSSYDLYDAPFMLWINDLAARDPYYILPLLAGFGILFQTTENTDMRGGITMLLFAAVIVAVTANLSAGLTLYLCVNTWLSIAQTHVQKALKI